MIRKTNSAFPAAAAAAFALAAIVLTPPPAEANPTFARMTGHTCAVCHVPAQEPLLNPTGQEFKSCGFSFCKGPPAANVQPMPPAPAPAPAPRPSAGPTFSCSGRLNDAEATICSDRGLAAVDVRMDEVYRRALARAGGGEAEGLRLGQRAFLEERNACGTDRNCIRDVYFARISAINSGR